MSVTAEEIISRVAVVGAPQYEAAMKRLEGASGRFRSMLGSLSSVATRSLSGLGLLAGGAAGGGILGLGFAAVDASSDFEQLIATLEVLTGSAEAAQKKMAFIRKLAIPATFTTSQLAQAAVQLEAFGLRTEKVLPLISKLGGAFQADSEHLQELVRMFGELRSGKFPEIEQLTRFGLNRFQFMQQGIKFDANGQLQSSAREAMEALERIINMKYGSILDRMAGTTASKMASLKDSWQKFLIAAGDLLVKYVNPQLERLTGYLDKIGNTNALTDWLKKAAAATLDFTTIALRLAGAWFLVAAAINFGMKNYLAGLADTIASVAAFMGSGMIASNRNNWLAKFGKFLDMPAAKSSGAGQVPGDTNPELGFTGNDSQLDLLRNISGRAGEISEHTKPLVDLTRAIFGGGPLGRLGISPVEMAGFRRGAASGGNAVTIQIYGGTPEKLEQAVLSMKRRGLL